MQEVRQQDKKAPSTRKIRGKSIPADVYEEYCEMVLDGWNDADIQEALNIAPYTFKKILPFLLAYFRNYMRDKTKPGSGKNLGSIIPLTAALREGLLDHVSAGLALHEAAAALGVPLPLIMDGWMKEDSALKRQVEHALVMRNTDVVRALYRRAVGYQHLSETTTVSGTEGYDREGNPVNTKTTTTVRSTKVLYGDVAAQRFWLINRLPEQWTTDGDERAGKGGEDDHGNETDAELDGRIAELQDRIDQAAAKAPEPAVQE